MPSHTRPLNSDGTCPTGFRKSGGICVRKIEKQERREGESKADCVSRKIPILIDEGMPPDQAVAAANSLCELNKGKDKDKSVHRPQDRNKKPKNKVIKIEKNFWGGIFNNG